MSNKPIVILFSKFATQMSKLLQSDMKKSKHNYLFIQPTCKKTMSDMQDKTSSQGQLQKWQLINYLLIKTRIPRKASSHLLAQKSQEPQSECGY